MQLYMTNPLYGRRTVLRFTRAIRTFRFSLRLAEVVQLYPNRPSGQLSRRTPTVIVSREARTTAGPRLRCRRTFPTASQRT